MRLFAPAMGIMDRLKYPAKFGLITLLMLIPILSLSYLFISEYEEQIHFLKQERRGLEYIASVRKLVENVPKHRGMSNGFLNGNQQLKEKLLTQRDVVDQLFTELQQVDTRLQGALKTSGKLAELQQQWEEIKTNGSSLSTKESFNRHTQLISDILALIAYVADTSGLILDPELDSYYLMDLLVNRLPMVVEAMGQARGLASGIAAQGNFTPQNWTELALRIDRFKTAESAMAASVNAGFNASQELAERLQESEKAATQSVSQFARMLKDRMLDSDTIEVSSSQVFDAGSQAIGNVFKFYDTILPFLDSIFERRINRNSQTEFLATSIIVIVLLVIIYLFSGFFFSVKRSIHQLSSASAQIANGDLTTRVTLSTRDELNQIGESVNDMVENFRKLVSTVIGSANQVASAAEELSAVTTQTERGVADQRSEIDQVATAMNEMSATVQEVARSASSASEAARHANQEADSGREVVNQTIQAIHQLSSEITSSSETISQLASNSQNIGNVLNVIKEIAEQTNLLALNAAIEAARAGEQGRGFAVVADEVRTLAQRTQESTKEIEEMITGLQSSAKAAVSTMGQSRDRTNETVDKANLAGSSLESIVEAIRSINDMNSHIATASEEQTAVTEEININITNVNNVSEQTALGARQTQSSSQELASLAQELQQVVNRFTV